MLDTILFVTIPVCSSLRTSVLVNIGEEHYITCPNLFNVIVLTQLYVIHFLSHHLIVIFYKYTIMGDSKNTVAIEPIFVYAENCVHPIIAQYMFYRHSITELLRQLQLDRVIIEIPINVTGTDRTLWSNAPWNLI